MCFLRNISIMHTPMPLGKGELMRITTDSFVDGTKKTTPKEVAFIENWIHNYPKKCLNYKSPREDFLMANLNLKLKFGITIFIYIAPNTF